MFKRIDHVEMTVANPEETIAFYTDVLGFRVSDSVESGLSLRFLH